MSRLRSCLSEGMPAFGLSCTLGSPLLAEIAAGEGYDYVCADMQHGVTDLSDLPGMLASIGAGGAGSPLVRVLRSDPAEIGRAFDSGADGVVVPMVETAAQAELAVKASRYPPEGTRSFGPFRAGMYLNRGRSPGEVNESAICLAMVETSAGLLRLDEICLTEGLSGIYAGPSDLTVALGGDPRSAVPPVELNGALTSIVAACRDRGLVPAVHARDLEEVERYIDMGFVMVTLGTDASLLRGAMQESLSAARGHNVVSSAGGR